MPAPFANLSGQITYVHQTGPTEYHSSCPQCGDSGHVGNDWPDRFVMRTEDHPRAFCRRCGHFVWADQLNGGKPPNPSEINRWRKEQSAREEARKRSAEIALSHLRNDGLWERYHEEMGEAGRTYWRKRGIPATWQDYWQLGWQNDSYWHTATATIPLFGLGWEVLNIKHRLIEPQDSAGKYRYQLRGDQKPPFLANPDKPIGGHAIVVEGEIKAAVTYLTLDSDECVLGIPGTNPGQATIGQLLNCERITLVMDPGAEQEAARLAGQLGKRRCRVLIPPMKIDDGILAAGLDKQDVRRMLGQAAPA